MDWEEALLLSRGGVSEQASHYRRKAAHVRKIAESATTGAVRTRLLSDALRFDEIVGSIDQAEQTAMHGK
jgi:hypothetical protein